MVTVDVKVRIPPELRRLGSICELKFREAFLSGVGQARSTRRFQDRTGETMGSLRHRFERGTGFLAGVLSVDTVAGAVQEYGQKGGRTQFTRAGKRSTAYLADRPAQKPRLFMRRSVRRAMASFAKEVRQVVERVSRG